MLVAVVHLMHVTVLGSVERLPQKSVLLLNDHFVVIRFDGQRLPSFCLVSEAGTELVLHLHTASILSRPCLLQPRSLADHATLDNVLDAAALQIRVDLLDRGAHKWGFVDELL